MKATNRTAIGARVSIADKIRFAKVTWCGSLDRLVPGGPTCVWLANLKSPAVGLALTDLDADSDTRFGRRADKISRQRFSAPSQRFKFFQGSSEDGPPRARKFLPFRLANSLIASKHTAAARACQELLLGSTHSYVLFEMLHLSPRTADKKSNTPPATNTLSSRVENRRSNGSLPVGMRLGFRLIPLSPV
jgi:hypothetical protein